uniref:Uncharacterized protein n=1 Tax=Tanacetum cinerariifolium TaxID=118510 RepID=A0A699LA74_TANCI|nr:hypothetical protein [Tanacetum cinerariifolium]
MVKPVWNNYKRVNHQNFAKKTHPCAKKNMVPRAVLMKSGLVITNTARQVNAAHSKTIVNAARPMTYLSKTTHSTVKRPIHKKISFKNSNKEQVKKQKSSEEAPETETSTEEFTKDKIKEIMHLVPVEDVYVQAFQVKHPIIDWKVHSEGERSYWQIIRLGGSSACYQFFVDLLRHLDREDLNKLWALVKEYLSIRPASSDKEMELWVELKRMYELDPEDQQWTLKQNYMHAPVEWKLFDLSGVHHVTSKDKEIFMLVEKDYPLRRGLALVMISYRLQVKNHSQMEEDLIKKIYNIANTPRKQSD